MTDLRHNSQTPKDSDNDGIMDHLDTDDDNDNLPTRFEIQTDSNEVESFLLDIDGDGIPNHLDINDDGDGLDTILEDRNGNNSPADDDLDGDQIIDAYESFLLDCDNDGVNDEEDFENCNPYNDSDGDGFTNIDELNAGFDPNSSADRPNNFNSLNFEISNFLSPNGDGINDTWADPVLERYSQNEVWIYGRSGQLVFHQKYYRNDWNGTYKGKELPEGAYYCLIDFDSNGSIDHKGWIYLTR